MSPKKKVNKASSPQKTKAKSKSELTLKQQKEILLQEARKQNREWARARYSEEDLSRMVLEAPSYMKSNTESKGAYRQYNTIDPNPEGRTPFSVLMKIGRGEMIDPDLEDKTEKTS